MRTTLTLDDDVAKLLEEESRRTHEPTRQIVNRIMRVGFQSAALKAKPKKYTVKPFDLGIGAEQWERWAGKSIHEILDEAEGPMAR